MTASAFPTASTPPSLPPTPPFSRSPTPPRRRPLEGGGWEINTSADDTEKRGSDLERFGNTSADDTEKRGLDFKRFSDFFLFNFPSLLHLPPRSSASSTDESCF